MKKTYFIMICIVMVSAFTAFGQSVVSGSIDADNNGNPEPLPAVSASETVPADPAAHTDTGAAEAEVPSAPEANAENEPSVAPKTVVIPEQSNKTQERKDVVEPVEKNEPTRRTKRKQRAFSMHTGFVVSATAANNMVSVPDFLKPQLVIDLNKLAKNTMKSGIHAGAIFDFDFSLYRTGRPYGKAVRYR